jgi:hypothetical protein
LTTVVVMVDGLNEHHCRGNGHFNVSDEHRRPPWSTVTAALRRVGPFFALIPDAFSRFDPNFGRKFSRPGIERLKRGGK